jgi:hypothetical protein
MRINVISDIARIFILAASVTASLKKKPTGTFAQLSGKKSPTFSAGAMRSRFQPFEPLAILSSPARERLL